MAHNIPVIGQVKSMGCWAAAFSMMYSWRSNASMPISVTLQKLGTDYVHAYNSNSGLLLPAVQNALDTLDLKREPPANPTTARWLQLAAGGPLFVVVDEELHPGKFAVHARVVFDIKSDIANTVSYVDPATNSLQGATASQPLAQFVRHYEQLAGTGWTGMQIIHY